MKKIIYAIFLITILTSPVIASNSSYFSNLTNKNILKNQYSTGVYSNENCGPTSVYMLFSWLEYNAGTVEEIRKEIRDSGGWVWTNEIEDYFSNKNIKYSVVSLLTREDLIKNLKENNCILLCVNISKISLGSCFSKIGKQSSGGTGHFILATGYYKDDNYDVIEILDPANQEIRYYKADELMNAITCWWAYGITVNEFALVDENDLYLASLRSMNNQLKKHPYYGMLFNIIELII